MKKWLVWLTVACLATCLGGCAPQAGSNVVSAAGDEATEVAYTVGVFKNLYASFPDDIRTEILRSVEELEEATKADPALAPHVEGYDAEFFKEKALLLLHETQPSGSIRIRIDSLQRQGKKLELVHTLITPEEGTDDMAYWRIVLEVKQGDIQGVTDFTAPQRAQ